MQWSHHQNIVLCTPISGKLSASLFPQFAFHLSDNINLINFHFTEQNYPVASALRQNLLNKQYYYHHNITKLFPALHTENVVPSVQFCLIESSKIQKIRPCYVGYMLGDIYLDCRYFTPLIVKNKVAFSDLNKNIGKDQCISMRHYPTL